MKIACVLLASGASERFQQNKLLAKFEGKTLAERAFAAVPAECFSRVVVVTAYAEVAAYAEQCGFLTVKNAHPERGVSHTIRLGLDAAEEADACLFCVCDQPYLGRESVARMARGYEGGIAALSFGGQRGNPAIFPRPLFGELRALSGDRGGSAVIERHRDILKLCPAECAVELWDADTREALAGLAGVKNLFLTGERSVGKSTLLERAVTDAGVEATGFVTRTYEINGQASGHYIHALSEGIAREENDKPISVRVSGQRCIPVERIFEGFGRNYLKAAMADGAPLVLMDELGVLERAAEKFKQEVRACLSGRKPVLGVLKDAPEDWLFAIRGRTDTRVLRLEADNRDAVLDEAMQFLRSRLKNET